MSISSQIGCILVRAGMKHEDGGTPKEAAEGLARNLNHLLRGGTYVAAVTDQDFNGGFCESCVALGDLHIHTYHDGRVWGTSNEFGSCQYEELKERIEIFHMEAQFSTAKRAYYEGEAAKMGVTVARLLYAEQTMGFDYAPWCKARLANPGHSLMQSHRAVQQYNNPCARNHRNMHPHLRNQDGSDQHMSDRQIAGMYYRGDKFAYEQMYKGRGGGGESNLSTVYGL